MDILFNPIFLSHDTGEHPERADRLTALGDLPVTDIPDGTQYLTLVHTPEYIAAVKAMADGGGGKLDPDTVVSAGTYNAAVHAVGATVLAAEQNAFAVVRPPGHHAHPDRSGGFCVFNNIAIAVQKLVDVGKRVFIFDFDGHLGDGTEKFFYGSDRVLYTSLHQATAYPGGGTADDIGYEAGLGYTVNVPLPPESGDDAYLRGTDLILSVARQFRPDVVAVSAGFDGHHSDPLLSLNLSMDTYFDLGQKLRQDFSSIFAVLEGGYNLDFFPKCFRNFLAGVNGGDKPYTERRTETMLIELENTDVRLEKLKQNLAPYWNL